MACFRNEMKWCSNLLYWSTSTVKASLLAAFSHAKTAKTCVFRHILTTKAFFRGKKMWNVIKSQNLSGLLILFFLRLGTSFRQRTRGPEDSTYIYIHGAPGNKDPLCSYRMPNIKYMHIESHFIFFHCHTLTRPLRTPGTVTFLSRYSIIHLHYILKPL